MPPKKRNSNWILWWLILVPTAVVIGKHMFEPVITLGEVIGFAIAIPAIIIGIWKTTNYFRYRNHPFNMWYQKELKYSGKLPVTDNKVISLGETKFILRIQPKRPTVFNDIHVKLLDKKNWKSTFPDRDEISVNDLNAEGMISSHQLVGHTEDNTNGLHAVYSPIYHRAPQEALVLTVKVIANKKWSGYIVFRAKREDGHQGYVYLPLQIEPTKM